MYYIHKWHLKRTVAYVTVKERNSNSIDRGLPEILEKKQNQKLSRFKLRNKISLLQILPLNQKMKIIQLYYTDLSN